MKGIFKQLVFFLERLSSEPEVGGLQITDLSLQYVLVTKEKVTNFSLRLPEGIIQEGIIKNPNRFVESLKMLHKMINKDKGEVVTKVVATLPAHLVHTQSFKVPYIDEERLKESAALNLQMISPIDANKGYMNWQKIGETEDEYELLGAFVTKESVDKLNKLLNRANFYPVTFEFPELALARLVSEILGPTPKALLVLNISSDGVGLLILKKGSLYFNHFVSWRKIQESNTEISRTAFGDLLLQEIKKVSNFSLSRLKENIENIAFIAPGQEKEIQDVVGNNIGIEARPLVINKYKMGPSWYVVLGSAIRGKVGGGKEGVIGFGKESAAGVFFKERLISFVGLWRNIIAVTLGIFVIIYGGFATFLVTQSKELDSQLKIFRTQAQQKELTRLEDKAYQFNNLVSMVSDVKELSIDWHSFLSKLNTLTKDNNVEILSLEVTSANGIANMVGQTADHGAVLKFKKVLIEEPGFEDVDLSLSRISVTPENSVNFALSFKAAGL